MENNTNKNGHINMIAQYIFKGFSIKLQKDGKTVPSPDEWFKTLVMPKETDDVVLTFAFSDVTKLYSLRGYEPIKVSIYKKEAEHYKPLLEDDNISCKISIKGWQPGEYALYIENAEPGRGLFGLFKMVRQGRYVYSFHLLSDGTSMKLPVVSSVVIINTNFVRLLFDAPFNPLENWFHYDIYDETGKIQVTSMWVEMPTDGMFVNMGPRPAVNLPDGRYRITVYQNNCPKVDINFLWENKEATDIRWIQDTE